MKLEAGWLVIAFAMTRIAAAEPAAEPAPSIKLGGYLEVYDQLAVQRPSNGVVNLRAFNARAETFALQNAVLEGTWTHGSVTGRIAFQIGEAGDLYYASEPARAVTGSAPVTGSSEWRHVQEAWAAWTIPCAKLELAGGLFLSPIGPEVVPTRDNWNWSRSNLFFALPAYHAGVRARRTLGDSGWSAIAGVYNGWNNVIDNNRTPSLSIAAAYAKDAWIAQVLYFGGDQRSPGAAEGSPWRHLLDAYVQGPLGSGWSFLVHADAGFERGAIGTSSWAGTAIYLRYDLTKAVSASARGDVIREWRPAAAGPIVAPVSWLNSGTATVAWRPVETLDLRLEYRHDQAAGDAYFGGEISTDVTTGAAIPNRRSQDTFTAGAIAWF